ncbi:phage tail tape measure protein [Thioclava sp. GXIMD2076]|uniref:phage tail tape measure protein n=1 Tax=Thioclava sp. GXIMD2076 TaxID=3131931 RepID=UPI0030CAA896
MDETDFDALSESAETLETVLGNVGSLTGVFTSELTGLRESMGLTTREMGTLSRKFSTSISSAFEDVILDGASLSSALRSVAESMSDAVYSAAVKPVSDTLGSTLASGVANLAGGLMPFANGGAFSSGKVRAFAKGGVVSETTGFAMRGGLGLMGEAGPEAIMPLTRGADGRLGVQAQGGRAVNVTMNVTTPDVSGFSRSRAQMAAQMSRALSRGSRTM